MADEASDLEALRDRHRQRRELADLHQAQVTALNAAPVQAWAAIPLFVSIAALPVSTGGYPEPLRQDVILTAILVGVSIPLVSKRRHG